MVHQLYSTYARKSPFLVERFNEYFLGGVDDMAAWSTNIFYVMSFLLDNGTRYVIHYIYTYWVIFWLIQVERKS